MILVVWFACLLVRLMWFVCLFFVGLSCQSFGWSRILGVGLSFSDLIRSFGFFGFL